MGEQGRGEREGERGEREDVEGQGKREREDEK